MGEILVRPNWNNRNESYTFSCRLLVDKRKKRED